MRPLPFSYQYSFQQQSTLKCHSSRLHREILNKNESTVDSLTLRGRTQTPSKSNIISLILKTQSRSRHSFIRTVRNSALLMQLYTSRFLHSHACSSMFRCFVNVATAACLAFLIRFHILRKTMSPSVNSLLLSLLWDLKK